MKLAVVIDVTPPGSTTVAVSFKLKLVIVSVSGSTDAVKVPLRWGPSPKSKSPSHDAVKAFSEKPPGYGCNPPPPLKRSLSSSPLGLI